MRELTLYRPGGHWCPLSLKFQFYFKKGSPKKFPRAYLSLCPEKRRKKNLVLKGLNTIMLVFQSIYGHFIGLVRHEITFLECIRRLTALISLKNYCHLGEL